MLTNLTGNELWQAIIDTLFMLGFATFFSILVGFPIGIMLFLSSKSGLKPNRIMYLVLSFLIDILRAVPFIILLIALMPVATIVIGTSLGPKGMILPLSIGAFPFFARLVQNSLNKVEKGILHMAQSLGASTWQIIWRVLFPEILPELIVSVAVTAITLVSYTAMAGVVGGGGLGDLAIRYGYQRLQTDVMLVTVVLLLMIVFLIQLSSDKLYKFFKK